MYLTNFLPAVGPHSGVNYTPPYTEGRPLPILHYKNGMATIPRQDGSWIDNGTGSEFIDYAEIQCVFLFAYDWLISRYTTATEATLQTAFADFAQYVAQGGLGVWTDTLSTGTKVNGATVTSRTFTGRLMGDVQPEYLSQAPTAPAAKLHATIIVPSGIATYSNNAQVPLLF